MTVCQRLSNNGLDPTHALPRLRLGRARAAQPIDVRRTESPGMEGLPRHSSKRGGLRIAPRPPAHSATESAGHSRRCTSCCKRPLRCRRKSSW